MFPQAYLTSVGQGIAAESLEGRLERQNLVTAVALFCPLHALHRVGYQGIHGLYEIFVLCFFVVGIVCILFVETVVVMDEIDRTKSSVFLNFTNHASDAVSIVGVILHRLANTIVTNGYQLAIGSHIPAYPLVHHRF